MIKAMATILVPFISAPVVLKHSAPAARGSVDGPRESFILEALNSALPFAASGWRRMARRHGFHTCPSGSAHFIPL
jgi:hypothetical protein